MTQSRSHPADASSETPKSSDQMPEEAPEEQVADDVAGAGEGAARETGRRHAEGNSHDPHEPRHNAPPHPHEEESR